MGKRKGFVYSRSLRNVHTQKREAPASQIRSGGNSGRRWSRRVWWAWMCEATGSGGSGSFGADPLRRILWKYSVPVGVSRVACISPYACRTDTMYSILSLFSTDAKTHRYSHVRGCDITRYMKSTRQHFSLIYTKYLQATIQEVNYCLTYHLEASRIRDLSWRIYYQSSFI